MAVGEVDEVDEFIKYDEYGSDIEEFDYDDFPRIINGVNVDDIEDGFLISDRLIQNVRHSCNLVSKV